MSTITKKIWTQELNNSSLTINDTFGLSSVSIMLISGTGTLLCNGSAGTLPSGTINLVIGIGVNISADSPALLTGINIATTGVLIIMGK